ncbi:hypothetical protein [Actinocrispum wychmicini]|uniref:Uncharacterized protein n=1 Tax=Actinocrispum wychmicini TaxID=1213861 RepID=A0A4R2JW39_9PSEU|nr:hypothetical protein [Actinocrispum wychmicini]TCO64701.1 hypothetical protein EV192_101483 [Actinocrispum wychmicini]
MRRFLVRAGIVLGGAVAGTAAAWLMSMSSASADTAVPQTIEVPQVVQPVVDTLTAPGNTPQFVEHIVTDVAAPHAPTKELTEFGKGVQGAFDRVGQQVVTQLSLPTGVDEPILSKPRLLLSGDHETTPSAHSLATESNTESAQASHDRAAARDTGRQLATESSRRAPPRDDESPALPALPPLPAPLAPPTAPSGACSSCGHGSNDDRSLPVSHTWPTANTGSATSRALRMITQHVATAMGEQPGVTPD